MLTKLEVGKKYKTRGGEEVTIINSLPDKLSGFDISYIVEYHSITGFNWWVFGDGELVGRTGHTGQSLRDIVSELYSYEQTQLSLFE